MAQHFLLSAASRTLSLRSIYKAGEDAAYATFCEMRWPETGGEAICPQCNHDEAYKITTRRKFKCKACAHQFSVTSGTIFASRKMDFVDLLAAICLIVNASKGISMVQLSRDIDCQYKTAFVLAHKLREAIAQRSTLAKFLTVTLKSTARISAVTFARTMRNPSALIVALRSIRQAPAALWLPCVSAQAARCHLLPSARGRVSSWRLRTYPAPPPCRPTRRPTGTRCTTVGWLTA